MVDFIFILILGLIVVFIAKVSFASANRDMRKTVAEVYEKSNYLSYDKTKHILIIKERFPGLSNVLKIEDHVILSLYINQQNISIQVLQSAELQQVVLLRPEVMIILQAQEKVGNIF